MGEKMKIKEQLKLQKDIEVPWHVWTKFGACAKKVSLHGNQVSLTNEADFANLEELRRAIEWYADQLGGKIKWDN
jgi:hypothetical protein